MEDLFEILIPLVIAGVYFFGNMLSKKSGDEFEEGLPMPRTREPEETEQQRQVREEIRRKIEDRKREAPATPASPGFPTPPPVTAPPEPARNVRERTKQTNERVHETRVPQPAPVSMPESVDSEPDFTWDASDDIYENTMEAQLAHIEATRKKAAALKAQSTAATAKLARGEQQRPRAGNRRLVGPVRAVLRTPDAVRAAFIYGEVLGPPVGLRPQACGAHKAAE